MEERIMYESRGFQSWNSFHLAGDQSEQGSQLSKCASKLLDAKTAHWMHEARTTHPSDLGRPLAYGSAVSCLSRPCIVVVCVDDPVHTTVARLWSRVVLATGGLPNHHNLVMAFGLCRGVVFPRSLRCLQNTWKSSCRSTRRHQRTRLAGKHRRISLTPSKHKFAIWL